MNTPLYIPELGDKFVDYRNDILGNSFTWSWERPITQVQYLVIHHSVTDASATADDIALLHKARGWGGIGYHFVITNDGIVWYVGDIGTARANVLNMNEKVIGICLIGDFTKYLPSDAQIISAHRLCKFLLDVESVPPKEWEDVVGHKELQATQCPGDSWNKSLEGDMWWRIKTGTPYTPQPQPVQEEVWKVTYRGEVLSIYDYNPTEKLLQLAGDIQKKSEEISDLTLQVGSITNTLQKQEADNASLIQQVTKLTHERDGCAAEVRVLERDIEVRDKKIKDYEHKIASLEADAPLAAYNGWELIKLGWSKLFWKRG
jgi:hypothetical protein